jgi:uncharacterized OB-fold protein
MSEAENVRPIPQKPVPVPSPESEPFWAAAKRHKLVIPSCNACRKSWFPPACLCPHCFSNDVGWKEVSGSGRVHTFAVFHRVYHPAFHVPYVVAVVELDEGPRLLTNIVNTDFEIVCCGMRVAVTFDDRTAEISVPSFVPDVA